MADKFTTPSANTGDRNSFVGLIRLAIQKQLQNTDDMLPASVISYDRATNVAKVQPYIYVITTDNRRITRAPIASVPVLQLGGGGFVLSFPINAGDLGWIKASDRDISNFKQSMENATPQTFRKHSFEDAMFIPDTMMKNVVIDGEDEANVVLQSIDGTQRVAIWSDQVKITATKIVLDAPLTEITGQLISGTNEDYDQTATFNGTIQTTGDVIGDSDGTTISLNTHVHSGVQTGPSNTGQPVP